MVTSARKGSICVGLTGGVGCGKSATRKILQEHGVSVLDTDELAHAAIAPGGEAYADVVTAFGPEILMQDGTINRKELGTLVFTDEAQRKRLNGLIHPLVRTQWVAWVKERRCAGEHAVVVIPLLYEVGAQNEDWDAVICVHSLPEKVRERLRQRGWSDEEAQRRVEAQWPVAEKCRRADFVIENNQGLDQLRANVMKVWGKISNQEIKGHG